jgi:3-oxoacyl-[acyl-carrier protein] reductase
MGSLGSKTALVTGASRAMGCTTAQTLASAGAHVIIHYGRGATEADALAADIRAAGG